ncbi:MAG: FAD-binding and (Fe-S)-binding domain-containing protein [Tetrasphaera sp.]
MPSESRSAEGGAFVHRLQEVLGAEHVSDRLLDRARLAHDASHYLLEPAAVVVARGAQDVAAAVAVAAAAGRSVTFRSGGTSLSGQAVTDGLLIDTRRCFREIEVLDNGARVRCQPGATVRAVNTRLRPYGRLLGPDPASEIACTIGGVVANNSSGMTCGTTANTYRTLGGMQVVLVSGTRIDTAAPDADDRLRTLEPQLYAGLLALRDRVRGNPTSVERIRHLFAMKNTMGYGLNAFLDYDTATQILAHLMIGSEGTLGFLVEATFNTVPLYAHAGTAFLVFDDIGRATEALPALVAAGTATAELLDASSLRVAQRLPVTVPSLRELAVERHTALLVEAQADSPEELGERLARLGAVVAGLGGLTDLGHPVEFTSDPAERAVRWQVRKGLYTAVAGARPAGSTALLEDVVVPMPALTGLVGDLQELCGRHGYGDTVIFGHAKDANLHFMINPDLRDPAQLERYAAFSDDLVDLVLAADGSLKAEHGTGRIMAPYVERQYGPELYAVIREIKRLFDPGGVLNPGVIVTDDHDQHLKDLKIPEIVDADIDRCVECGYCEPACPAKDVTTTPRQRIVLMRELQAADTTRREELSPDFTYAAVETCAADSLCLLSCPVGIDTGKVMKRKRHDAQPVIAQRVADGLAENWATTLTALRCGIGVAEHLPVAVLTAATQTAREFASPDLIPLVGDDLPGPGVSRRTSARHEPGDVVFFASCMGELFAAAASPDPTAADSVPRGAAFAFLRLCDAAGVRAQLPVGLESLCCGTVWRSKGLTDGLRTMAIATATALLTATRGGAVPVVAEASSCTHGLHSLAADLAAAGEHVLAQQVAGLDIMDSTRFVATRVLPGLTLTRRVGSVVVHPTCSDQHAGDIPHLLAIAQACADRVVVPDDAGCCAFAGDRGLLHPELTASATRREAAEVSRAAYDAYVSTNRTCEIGMSRATGRPYRHVLELLDELVAESRSPITQGGRSR